MSLIGRKIKFERTEETKDYLLAGEVIERMDKEYFLVKLDPESYKKYHENSNEYWEERNVSCVSGEYIIKVFEPESDKREIF